MDRKLGALMPGTAKASAVLKNCLDGVIEMAMSGSEKTDPHEKDRKEHTMLSSLLSQNISKKVSSLH